jgi:protein-disulfide isomerase
MDQNNFTPGKTFGAGIAVGFLVLCTIGFFIMLAVFLGGNGGSSNDAVSEEDANKDYPKKFSECLDADKYAAEIQSETQEGGAIGVQGTPATFINGYLLSGAMPYQVIKNVIDDLLAGKEPFIDNYADLGLESGTLQKAEMPDLSDAVWRGEEKATVSLVEYSDFECPYCARFAPTVEQALTDYAGKVRFTFRHFPLSFHTNAQKAAEAFECAKEQGKAYEMHDKLFELSNAGTLGLDNYKKAAKDLGLK